MKATEFKSFIFLMNKHEQIWLSIKNVCCLNVNLALNINKHIDLKKIGISKDFIKFSHFYNPLNLLCAELKVFLWLMVNYDAC